MQYLYEKKMTSTYSSLFRKCFTAKAHLDIQYKLSAYKIQDRQYLKGALWLCHKIIPTNQNPTLIKCSLSLSSAKSICTIHDTYHAMYHCKILSNKPIYISKYTVNV